jgi:hypothetical protein
LDQEQWYPDILLRIGRKEECPVTPPSREPLGVAAADFDPRFCCISISRLLGLEPRWHLSSFLSPIFPPLYSPFSISLSFFILMHSSHLLSWSVRSRQSLLVRFPSCHFLHLSALQKVLQSIISNHVSILSTPHDLFWSVRVAFWVSGAITFLRESGGVLPSTLIFGAIII